jgi:hypothetical protein
MGLHLPWPLGTDREEALFLRSLDDPPDPDADLPDTAASPATQDPGDWSPGRSASQADRRLVLCGLGLAAVAIVVVLALLLASTLRSTRTLTTTTIQTPPRTTSVAAPAAQPSRRAAAERPSEPARRRARPQGTRRRARTVRRVQPMPARTPAPASASVAPAPASPRRPDRGPGVDAGVQAEFGFEDGPRR